MRTRRLLALLLALILLGTSPKLAPPRRDFPGSTAETTDTWWDNGWPYRIRVVAAGEGIASSDIGFSGVFDALGLRQGLLDLRSIRVVPYTDRNPGEPIPYAETYTTMLEDADDPQIDWHESGVYWAVNDGSAEEDDTRLTQGTGSLKATIENWPGGYGYPGVELRIVRSDPRIDWSAYEVLLYDVWPQVNDSAVDQAPDLYSFKLYNACGGSPVTQGGPPLALGRWNHASVSLNPLDSCWPSDGLDLSDITRMEFHTRDNDTVSGNSGFWDGRDVLTRLLYLRGALFLGTHILPAVGMGISRIRGFPPRSCPYTGHVLLFSLCMMNVATPGPRIFNHTFGPNGLCG